MRDAAVDFAQTHQHRGQVVAGRGERRVDRDRVFERVLASSSRSMRAQGVAEMIIGHREVRPDQYRPAECIRRLGQRPMLLNARPRLS